MIQPIERKYDEQYQQHTETNIYATMLQERYNLYGIGYECEDGHIARMTFD